ncbi:MAG TPA: TonB-dependent receptor [Longimicrobiaceae bacterium]|nr:TonB-dependent receptor [Longimicrobiaceae bacterium]
MARDVVRVAPPIVGLVQDTTGRPLPNVQIVVAEINRLTTTAADGRFVIRALRPGTYHLDAVLIGYAPGHAVVTVPESGEDVHVTISLRPTPLQIEGINVTASAATADPLNITQSTLELSGKALERNLGGTVAQTLSREPGIATRYGGPATSTPVIRGLSGERVLVLQNGQRTGDLSSTSADHALSIDPLSASRLEVVRGPASLLYGSNALGGVVNVVSTDIPTNVPSHIDGYLAAQGESVNPGGAFSGAVTLPVGSFLAVTARGGGRSTGDVRIGGGGELENTFYRNRYVVGGIGYVRERVQGGLSVGGYGFRYGLPAPPDAEEAGVSIEGSRLDTSGRVDLALGGTGLTNLRVEGSAQWYGHDEVEESGEIGSSFELNTQTAGIVARTGFGRMNGAVGVSGLFKQYSAEGEEALTPAADSRNGGVFVYQEIPLLAGDQAPRFQVGARYDVYRIESQGGGGKFGPARTRDFDNLSGSVGLTVPMIERLSAGVSVARSFRAPTVEELFSNAFHAAAGTYDVGNPDLAVETNSGVEAVLRAQSERVNAQVAAFYNRIDNYITPVIVGDTTFAEDEGEVTVPLNVFDQEDARLRGLEGQVEAAVGRNFVVGAMGDLVRGSFGDGSPLPFIPAPRIGASAGWDDGRWSLGLEARHSFRQDRVSQPGCAAGDDGCVDIPTGAYTVVDLNAGFRLISRGRVHSLTLRADNLLDERYREASSRIKSFAPNPGRNLSLVYRVLF